MQPVPREQAFWSPGMPKEVEARADRCLHGQRLGTFRWEGRTPWAEVWSPARRYIVMHMSMMAVESMSSIAFALRRLTVIS